MGMGLGLGPRRIRRRCPDWRGVVAAGLLLLLSGLQLPRVRLWLRVSGLRLRLSGLFLRRLLRRLTRAFLLGEAPPPAPRAPPGGLSPVFFPASRPPARRPPTQNTQA